MKITALTLEALAKWGLSKSSFMRMIALSLEALVKWSPINSFKNKNFTGLIALLLLFVFSLSFLASSVQAYDTGYDSSQGYNQNISSNNTLNTNSDVPKNFHSFTQVLMLESLSAVICQLSGFDPITTDHKCLGVNPNTGKIGFVENGGGLLGVVGSMIDSTFVPPASSLQYLAYMKNNFGLTKSAYAAPVDDVNSCALGTSKQGVGFCGLLPVLDLWLAMRNIVYLILVLIFIVIGLGIMLRIHIDPRTVMTVQNQIPKIIAGIIIISFSFAIAGFLIDIMWVTTYLFAGVITSATGNPLSSATMMELLTSGNPIDAANTVFVPDGIVGIAGTTAEAFGTLVENAITGKDSGFIGDAIGGAMGFIAFLVILIAIIVALLRLWVSLVITYINIILDVIFAPFWLIAGILPGSTLGLGGWFKDLLGNLAVFPVAISFFLLANYFVTAFNEAPSTSGGFAPPLLGGTNQEAIAAIIGLGFILMLPNVLTTVKAFFKAPKVNFGPIMKPVGVGVGVVGKIPGGFQSYISSPKAEMTDKGYERTTYKRKLARTFGIIK